jgi:hypothetical protein
MLITLLKFISLINMCGIFIKKNHVLNMHNCYKKTQQFINSNRILNNDNYYHVLTCARRESKDITWHPLYYYHVLPSP